jgi:hypothetical protein
LHPMRGSLKLRPLNLSGWLYDSPSLSCSGIWETLNFSFSLITSEMLQEDSFIGALDEFTKD